MIPDLDNVTGLLPLGRYPCTENEVEAGFVTAARFSASPTRTAIWADWRNGLQLLQTAATVHAAWLGGSFTTAKLDPDDLDVTFVINGTDHRSRTPPEQKIVTIFARARVKAELGLRLDSYVVDWECVPAPQRAGLNGAGDGYFWGRGHWDDWWQRNRLSPKGSPAGPADTLPRRGYLEVRLSDYP